MPLHSQTELLLPVQDTMCNLVGMMLLLRIFLSFSVIYLAVSEGFDSSVASKFWRSKARNEFKAKVDKGNGCFLFINLSLFNTIHTYFCLLYKAYKSDRFNAVGGLRGADLAASA